MDEWRMGVKGTKLGMDAVGLVKRTKLRHRRRNTQYRMSEKD